MKLKHQTETTFINKETGESFIQTTEKKFSIKTTSEGFYMTFLSAIQNLVGLSGTELRVLSKLCAISEYNTGIVYLPPDRRVTILEEMSLKKQTFSNALVSLRKKDFITGSGGVFKINPEYHWKGETSVRDKILKNELEITFNAISIEDNLEESTNSEENNG